MTQVRASIDDDLAEEVSAFLRAHPAFLAERPELYRVLAPPQRVHGEHLADHMAAMIRAERAYSAHVASRADGMVTAGRAAAGLTERVQQAVVALIRSPDPIEFVSVELPGLLGLDAASLCLECDWPGTRELPDGAVARLLGGREVLFRQVPTETRLLHGEAAGLARHDALVQVRLSGGDGLLALASRDRRRLNPEQGAASLAFLGQSLAAALERLP